MPPGGSEASEMGKMYYFPSQEKIGDTELLSAIDDDIMEAYHLEHRLSELNTRIEQRIAAARRRGLYHE